MNYPISVVVPTKNRYKYLKSLIELIINFNTDELELIIQDNSDDNSEIMTWLKDKNFQWLKYYFCPEKLTSIQNFDRAINNATGDYVCFIGDDDGIVRNIVGCVKWMKENNIDAVRSAEAGFMWPETGKCGGCVDYEENNNNLVEYLNPIRELVKILRTGVMNLGNIPLVYNGIVKKDVLDIIYSQYNTYFPGGASADAANGVALCFYVKRFAKVYTPIIIRGTSLKTGGVSNRRQLIPLNDISFISRTVIDNWEGDIPNYWYGGFVWPESVIKSLRCLHQEAFINCINYNHLLGRAAWKLKMPSNAFCEFGKWHCIVYYKYTAIIRKVLHALLIRIKSKFFRDDNQLPFRQSKIINIIEAESRLQVDVNWEELKIARKKNN